MNKKFSTLMVGALLASSVGAFAQGNKFGTTAFTVSNTEELSDAKYYALNVGTTVGSEEYIGVQNSNAGVFQFKSLAEANLNSLAQVDSFLWKISTVTTDGGFTRFVLENKATGVIFSFNEDNAVVGSAATATAKSQTIEGLSQWKWLESRFTGDLVSAKAFTIDFADGDSVMTVKKDANNVLYAVKDHKKNSLTGISVQVVKPNTWVMSAVDLNTKGDAVKYMQLTFDGAAATNNLFADKYQVQGIAAAAKPAEFITTINGTKDGWTTQTPETDWLVLNKIGADGKVSNKYAHVDTSYFQSKGETYKTYNPIKVSTNTVMTKAGAIDTLGYNLPGDAFRFKFTKNLMTDSIKIESLGSFVELATPVVPKYQKGGKLTSWSMHTTSAKLYTAESEWAKDVKDNTQYTVLSHCTLEGETSKVVTFYTDDNGKAEDNYVNLYAYANGISDDFMSIPAGVYKIQNVKTKEFYGVHIYTTDSVADWTGKAAIDNMEFDHMPAFQWVVVKTDVSDKRIAISPVSITNREFNAKNNVPVYQLRKGENYDPHKLIGMFNGVEVEFIPVAAASVSNKYLGYKNYTDAELEFNGYNFNYWHPYAQDRYLDVNKKDSILNVLTTDAGRFTIEGTKEAAYGYTPSAAAKAQITGLTQLYRRAYTVSLDREAIYQNVEGQFVVTKDAARVDKKASFYFKENNEFEKAGEKVCYYALIAQNINTKAGVRQNDDKALLLSEVLTEISTATFDIQEANQPLYRRFNTKLEGVEDGKDAPVYLKFKESYVGDYLMDETNENFKRKGMSYLGIGNTNIAEAGLSFYVRPFNIGKSDRYDIKPQYLIYVSDKAVTELDTIPCDATNHTHMDADGNKTTDPKKCTHATIKESEFNRYKLLVSFADSAKKETGNVVSEEQLYKFGKYTRVGFVDAVEKDSVIYILGNEFATVADKDLKLADIKKALEAKKISSIDMKKEVKKDDHHNYTWSFRYTDPANVDLADAIEEERSFLIESNNYDGEKIAPNNAAWLKNQNNCLVLTDDKSDFEDAKVGDDSALIFNLYEGSEDDMATENEEISTSTVSVSAVNGGVVVKGAEGKTVVITNVLGQTVANTVITSNEATIAAPAGVVVVAVEGEAAVKAIVK